MLTAFGDPAEAVGSSRLALVTAPEGLVEVAGRSSPFAEAAGLRGLGKSAEAVAEARANAAAAAEVVGFAVVAAGSVLE